ncbi:MAG: hypothetical protein HKN49_13955 [Gammaproteobacteria bacterium]|nr:hypothetical protein [Gammaproteobacteria bacterium]
MRLAIALTLLSTVAPVWAWTPPDMSAYRDQLQIQAQQRDAAAQRDLETARATLAATRRDLRGDRAVVDNLRTELTALDEQLQQATRRLAERRGDVYDIYTTARQGANDLLAMLDTMPVAPPDDDLRRQLQTLANNPAALTLDELSQLWVSLHQVLTYSATQSRTVTAVQTAPGVLTDLEVLRVGTRIALADGYRVVYDPLTGLYRQSPDRVATSDDPGWLPIRFFTIDATANSPLAPAIVIHDAGFIGLAIVALGVLGTLILLFRLALVLRARYAQDRAPADSPSAHLVAAGSGHRKERLDSVAGWINTAVRREIRHLTLGQSTLSVIVATAPLLGLLGTVTGMIVLFGQVSLTGGGDPVAMAGGIARALTTTLLGLVVAVPLLLGHRWVSALAANLVHELDTTAAGLVAERSAAR